MTEILTTRAVAERLNVNPATVTRWVRDGWLIPFHRTPGLRGALLFTVEEVDRLAATRREDKGVAS